MYKQIEELHKSLNHLQNEYWLHSDLFSLQWWIIVVLNIGLLIIFLLLIDRQRILTVLIAFFVAFIVFGTIDEIGVKFMFWEYPHQFLYFTARFNAADFGIVPGLAALLYQYCSKWKPYLIGNLFISVIISFIGVPIFVKFGIYKMFNWNYLSSFIITILCMIVIKAFTDFIVKKQKK